MAIESRATGTGRTIIAYTPSGDSRTIDPESNSMSQLLRAINELGREGWQLVDTELFAERDMFRATYYLKRRVEESGGGWATTV